MRKLILSLTAPVALSAAFACFQSSRADTIVVHRHHHHYWAPHHDKTVIIKHRD